MTKLEAVNMILRAGGLRPVGVLDTDGNSDAAEAERLLDECDLEIQGEGWHYNTRKDVTLTPDSDGEITFGDDIIWIDTYGTDKSDDLAQIGRRLYDNKDNTFTFESTDSFKVTYVERWSFACIPVKIRYYIAKYAAWQYACDRHDRGALSRNKLQKAYDEYIMARSAANRFNSQTTNVNMLDSTHHRRVRGDSAGVVR